MILSTFIILGFSLGLFETPAHAKWPPAVEWQEVQTKHFDVHFTLDSKKFAETALPELEGAYQTLSNEFNWSVALPIQVIIDSFHDQSNGATSAFPENRIVLRPISFEAATSIGEYDDWIRTLVIHEMTHLVSLDLTNGFFSRLRAVFGSAAKMNVFEPVWMQEGLATYFETRLSSKGRGRSLFLEQVLRSAFTENVFHSQSQKFGISIDRLNEGALVWPTGDVPYLLGYALSAEMARKGGVKALIDLQHQHSSRIPFLIEDLPRKNFKKGFLGIWNDTISEIQTRASNQIGEIKKGHVSDVQWVTHQGRMSAAPEIVDQKLWFLADSFQDGFALVGVDFDTKNEKIFHRFEKPIGKSLKFSKNSNGFIYSRIESFDQFCEFSDVFFFDLASQKEIQITHGLRAHEPDFSRDFIFENNKIKAGRIVYVKNFADGNQGLATFDGLNEEILVRGHSFERFSFPKWNKKSDEIIYSFKLRNGLESIHGFNAVSHLDRVWIEGRNGEVLTTPDWTSDSNQIIFTSSRSGVFNAEKMHWGHEPVRVTHLETGLFYPLLTSDSRLGAMVYRASGYDFAWITTEPTQSGFAVQEKILTAPDSEKFDASRVKQSAGPPDRERNLIKELLPHYWYPLFQIQNEGFSLGATTSGRDAKNIHSYEASVSYDSRATFWTYHLTYDYDGLYPTIEIERELRNQYIAFISSSNPQTETSVSSKYYISDFLIEMGATLSESRFQSQSAESGGLRTQFSHSHFSKTPDSIEPEFGTFGHLVEIETAGYFVGDEQFAAVSARGEVRVPGLFQRHFFRWISDGARSSNRNFSAYYFVGGAEASLTRDPKFLLRGYPSGALLGRSIFTSNLEYEFPIIDLFRGFTTQPFFYERAKMKFFADVGSAEKIGANSQNFKRWPIGVGVQFIQDFKLLFRLPMSFSLGIHRGLSTDELGESQIQLGLFSRID